MKWKMRRYLKYENDLERFNTFEKYTNLKIYEYMYYPDGWTQKTPNVYPHKTEHYDTYDYHYNNNENK